MARKKAEPRKGNETPQRSYRIDAETLRMIGGLAAHFGRPYHTATEVIHRAVRELYVRQKLPMPPPPLPTEATDAMGDPGGNPDVPGIPPKKSRGRTKDS